LIVSWGCRLNRFVAELNEKSVANRLLASHSPCRERMAPAIERPRPAWELSHRSGCSHSTLLRPGDLWFPERHRNDLRWRCEDGLFAPICFGGACGL